MDPHSFIARAEAQRWLEIAEKLLLGRDLVGSKSFALRARESDPRSEPAEQILAVADTLLAAEKRIGPGQQPDLYSILQLVRLTDDVELIAGQYRRLALLLNPHKNRAPFADEAFRVVSDAWSVLSNPVRKSVYDGEIGFSGQGQGQNLGFVQDPIRNPGFQQHNFFNSIEQQENVNVAQNQQQQHHFLQQQQQQLNFFNQMGLGQPFQTGSGSGSGIEQEQAPAQVNPFQVRPQQVQSRPSPRTEPRPDPPQRPQPVRQQPAARQAQPVPAPAPVQAQPQPQPPPWVPVQPQQPRGRNLTDDGIRVEETVEMDGNEDVIEPESFWTACPYCYNMYEYPGVYAECTLRCAKCRRAFEAVRIPPPPETVDGDGNVGYFCCWGFYPLGISSKSLEKNKGKEVSSGWSPFSPLLAPPQNSGVKKKRTNIYARRYTGPVVYIDDDRDDVYVPSDDSDVDWRNTNSKKKKKLRRVKRKVMSRERVRPAHGAAVEDVGMGNGEVVADGLGGVADGLGVPEGVLPVPNRPVAESSKKPAGSTTRRQSGRGAKEMGKLDLNVEFNNNEGEAPARRISAGNRGEHGEEDNMFFEGLDEFLSSLPIINNVGDANGKVKAG